MLTALHCFYFKESRIAYVERTRRFINSKQFDSRLVSGTAKAAKAIRVLLVRGWQTLSLHFASVHFCFAAELSLHDSCQYLSRKPFGLRPTFSDNIMSLGVDSENHELRTARLSQQTLHPCSRRSPAVRTDGELRKYSVHLNNSAKSPTSLDSARCRAGQAAPLGRYDQSAISSGPEMPASKCPAQCPVPSLMCQHVTTITW